ncbi:MAG: hypothetical protein L3J12_09990, partial [Spirochaetales bacterium]|nr:hypothetical protein [Spirochaetales bacterium]
MFSMNLILKKTKDSSLKLVLPVWFRGIFLFIALLLGAGLFISSGNSRLWLPAILILGSLMGSLYEEKWIFSKALNKIEYKAGLVILNKKSSYKM